MIDVKFLRENPDIVKAAINRKKFSCDIDAILELDKIRRSVIQESEQARAEQKLASKEMGKLPKASDAFQEKIAEMRALSAQVKDLQNKQQEIEAAWNKAFLMIPNMPHDSVPSGREETDNQVVATWGDPESVSPYAMAHYDLPWFNRLVDLERGHKITGAGWPVFVGDVARLVRALIQFFLNEAEQSGYVEVMPPLAVNEASGIATGQLPDKEGQMYHIGDQDFYLIPTAETPVTNLYRDEILDPALLPLKHCAYTPCFRREAGSYGKHVRGLNRVHQFDKVELVKWVKPETSFDELESLLSDAQDLLLKLEIPHRVLLMCSGVIGFAHAKQYDLEVWSGGQKRWLEVSSCSNFTDFQARRANTRFRGDNGKPTHVHTLNGSALAIPRTLIAILENNLQADHTIRVPKVLQPLVGKEFIGIAS